jgi:hypothetical protein
MFAIKLPSGAWYSGGRGGSEHPVPKVFLTAGMARGIASRAKSCVHARVVEVELVADHRSNYKAYPSDESRSGWAEDRLDKRVGLYWCAPGKGLGGAVRVRIRALPAQPLTRGAVITVTVEWSLGDDVERDARVMRILDQLRKV